MKNIQVLLILIIIIFEQFVVLKTFKDFYNRLSLLFL